MGHFIDTCITALMQDQVSRFRLKGLKAAYVGGEEEKEFDGVVNGDVQLVYLSLESDIEARQEVIRQIAEDRK